MTSSLTSVDFAHLGQELAAIVRNHGLRVPDFRTPRHGSAAGRAIQRRQSTVTVAVRYRNRPAPAVVADMIEGIVQANPDRRLGFAIRDELWLTALAQLALSEPQERAPAQPGDATTSSPPMSDDRSTSSATPSSASPGSGPSKSEAARRAA